jgi:AcrR family transcriptional regulator
MPRRGRPIEYDPETALTSARDVFWATGFAASSLDALSEATGMNRPSLAGAFGDKEALYVATLGQYRDRSIVTLTEKLSGDEPLRKELARVYATATDIYLSAKDGARGCFLIGTATVEAVHRPAVRSVLLESLTAFNAIIEKRIAKAIADGEIDRKTDTKALASIASAVLHSLAVRARAGESRKALDALAKTAVDLICRN